MDSERTTGPMILTFEFDIDSVKTNQDQRSLSSNVVVRTHRQTHTDCFTWTTKVASEHHHPKPARRHPLQSDDSSTLTCAHECPQEGTLYSNMTIGTLALDECTVILGTVKSVLGG